MRGTLSYYNRKRLMLPMILVQIYLSGTLLLFIFGPWKWPIENSQYVILLLILYQLALLLGYWVALKRPTKIVAKNARSNINKIGFLYKLYFAMAINLIITILAAVRNMRMEYMSIVEIIRQGIAGIFSPSMVYAEKFEQDIVFGGSVLPIITVLLGPISWIAFSLSIVYFKRLNFIFKLIAIFTILIESFRWFGIGTNKGIGDLLVIFTIAILVPRFRQSIYHRKKFTKKQRKQLMVVIILFLSFLYLFTYTHDSRLEREYERTGLMRRGVELNYDSPLMKYTPNALEPTVVYLNSYLAQGYYGLYLSTKVEWIPMFGTGNNTFVMHNIEDLFETDLKQYTYQVRVEKFNWSSQSNWSSFYSWMANDFGHLGVIFVMFFVGFLYAKLFIDYIINKRIVTLPLISLVTILLLYLPANNQLFSFPTTFVAFWVLLIYWLLTNRYGRIVLSKI